MDLSVITLTYNSEKYLLECLDSILLAKRNLDSNVKFEHIICDGESSDKTREIALSHSLESTLLTSPTKGLYSSLDYAIKMASGKYILYVHSDDFIAENFFSILLKEAIKQNSKYGSESKQRELILPCSDVAFINDKSTLLWYRRQPKMIPLLQEYSNLVLHPNCLFNRNVEISYPYCDKKLSSSGTQSDLDWRHINTLVGQGVKFYRTTGTYYYFRIHSGSTTMKSQLFNKSSSSVRVSILMLLAKIYIYCHETRKLERIIKRLVLGQHSWRL
jgi:glycosyltransferase involved in cell wall biosynthesis